MLKGIRWKRTYLSSSAFSCFFRSTVLERTSRIISQETFSDRWSSFVRYWLKKTNKINRLSYYSFRRLMFEWTHAEAKTWIIIWKNETFSLFHSKTYISFHAKEYTSFFIVLKNQQYWFKDGGRWCHAVESLCDIKNVFILNEKHYERGWIPNFWNYEALGYTFFYALIWPK